MGLDAYVGRVSRVSDEYVERLGNRFSYNAYASCDANVVLLDMDAYLSDDVREIARVIDTYSCGMDWDLLRADYDVNPKWECRSYGVRSEGTRIVFAEHLRCGEPAESIEIFISDSEMEHRYETIERVQKIAFLWNEIAYWRGENRGRRIMKERYGDEIVNCGYHGMTVSDYIDIFCAKKEEWPDVVSNEGIGLPIVGALYAYHEWY